MNLTRIREAAFMQSSYLINQNSSKKGYKQTGGEISKISEYFGNEFDKHTFKSLLEEIDFKDQRSLLSNKNTSNKIQLLIQEFPNLLARPDFINIFSHIIEVINTNASATELFDSLVKLLKLSYENQFKILISFFYSSNQKYKDEIRNVFILKCQEVQKDPKPDQLTYNTIQMLILLINSFREELKNDNFQKTSFMNYLISKQAKVGEIKDQDEFIEEFNTIMDSGEDTIEFEKILTDLGPLMINNNINLSKNEQINCKLDERRLASFIIYITKQFQCTEDKEVRNLNKIFLQTLGNDLSMTIDENNEKKLNVGWNLENFFKMTRPFLENLDFNLVFSFFDDPNFVIKDKKTLDNFVLVMKHLKISQYQNILMNTLFRRWSNEINQIETLNFLINNPQSEAFSFKYSQKKINKNTMSHLIENWSSIDLIEALIRIARGNNYLKIKDMFDWPISNCPEILVIGLSLIKAESEDFLYEELINEVLPPFLGNHINSIAVLEEVWTYNKDLVIKTICTLYKNNPDMMNLSKILDITQKLKDSLIQISSCSDHNFTVNLAILAVKRDFLHIDQWLNERITKIGDDFIEALLNYIKENVIKQCRDITTQTQKESILERCQLTLESLAIIFENLSAPKIKSNPKISKRMQNEINTTYKEIFELFDELQTQPQNSEEIEEAANKLFHNLFHGEASVDQTIEIISNYKNSQNQMESEIYACMIHSLLDEYRFFHKYPEKELKTMATLFGQIINHNLFDDIIETISMKFIIEGIKKGSGKMFMFSTVALEQFVDKLQSFLKYVQSFHQVINFLKPTNISLYERLLEKLNEINNKNRTFSTSSLNEDVINQNLPKQTSSNNFGAPSIKGSVNFEHFNEKGNNLPNVMPMINEKNFYMNYDKLNNQNNIQMNQLNNYMGSMANNNNQYNINTYLQSQGGNMNKNLNKDMSNYVQMNMYNNEMYMPGYYYPQGVNMAHSGSSESGHKKMPIGATPQMSKEKEEIKENKQQQITDFQESYYNMPSYDNPRIKEDSTVGKSNDDRKRIKDYEESLSSYTSDKQQKRILRINNAARNNPDIITNYMENENLVQAPSQDIVERINFIFNSMSKINIRDKSNELKDVLTNESLLKWFSNYFILNRASGENNNHNNYGELISHIDSKELNQLLIKDTIHIIKKLIVSEKLIKDEKTILKCLGSWLGIMTLAKNKPILSKDLEFKELIYDAYQNGRLSAIIPFICGILGHSSKTKVFHPKNPWIQAIMAVLNELYNKSHLKITLKFEIDNIFKKLEIDMSTVSQSRLLENAIPPNNSPDFTKDNNFLEAKFQDLYSLINTNIIDQYTADLQMIIKENNSNCNISNSEIINLVTTSLVNAINDIIQPVIERAVNISLVTTKELVLKDFAFDSDEKKFGNASNLCIKSLAGSLAMVTCKEPLRMSFINHFKELLSKKLLEDLSIEYINNINNSEILDIGCNFIQNNVVKRAIDKIEKDKIIIEEIEKRKKQKQLEQKPELMNKIFSLPDILKPNIIGLTNEQYRIYEDFEKVYDSNRKEVLKKNSLIKMIVPLLKEFMVFTMQNVSKANDRYEICLKNLGCISLEHYDIEYIEDDENITSLSKMMLESRINESIAIDLINTNLKYVFSSIKTRNLTLLNLYSETLRGWILLHPKLAKEVTLKVLYNEDLSLRFIYDIHSYFLRKNLFEKAEYEKICLSYLEDPIITSSVRTLFKRLLDKNIVQLKDFHIIPHYMIDKTSNTYFDLFFNKKSYCFQNPPNLELTDWKIVNIRDNENYIGFRDMSIFTFSQIMNLYYKNFDHETLRQFLKTFNESSISKSEDQMNALISIITEYSVKECLFYSEGNYVYSDRLLYNKIDSLARFIILLLNYITNSNKLKFFENILFGIFKILHLDYLKNQASFNQKPYYRLFINIIYSLYHSDSSDPLFNAHKKIHYFFVLADFFRTLRPQNYPGFAVAWLDLLSYKYFSSILIGENDYKYNKVEYMQRVEKYLNLVTDITNFLKIYKDEVIKTPAIQKFLSLVYKYIYLLTKSYPEFVSFFYYIIIYALPSEGLNQVRNIILSATPFDVEITDPFSEDFKIENNPNILKQAVSLIDLNLVVPDNELKNMADEFLEYKSESLIDEIIKKLNKKDVINLVTSQSINWLVLYFAYYSLTKKVLKDKEVIDIFMKMLKNFDAENRDYLINSLINELRYPCSQTHYFYFILLCIYKDIKVDIIEEHIYKNLVERLLFKPTPWGVLVIFLEFSRNSMYNQMIKKSYENHSFGMDKIIDDIQKYVQNSKFNRTLDNFVC